MPVFAALWERWPREARTEREKRCGKALSVACGASSPRGGAKGAVRILQRLKATSATCLPVFLERYCSSSVIFASASASSFSEAYSMGL